MPIPIWFIGTPDASLSSRSERTTLPSPCLRSLRTSLTRALYALASISFAILLLLPVVGPHSPLLLSVSYYFAALVQNVSNYQGFPTEQSSRQREEQGVNPPAAAALRAANLCVDRSVAPAVPVLSEDAHGVPFVQRLCVA